MISIMQSDLLTLFATTRTLRLAAGAPLFAADTAVTEIFLVRSGSVHLVRHTATGARLILQAAEPDDILAEASAYSDVYHCDAVAVTNTVLAALPRSRFLSDLARNPDLAASWAARLARGMQAARQRAEIRTLPKLCDRLDAWLDAGNVLPEKGAWQDVAADLGVTREALYRELARRRAD